MKEKFYEEIRRSCGSVPNDVDSVPNNFDSMLDNIKAEVAAIAEESTEPFQIELNEKLYPALAAYRELFRTGFNDETAEGFVLRALKLAAEATGANTTE